MALSRGHFARGIVILVAAAIAGGFDLLRTFSIGSPPFRTVLFASASSRTRHSRFARRLVSAVLQSKS